MRFNTVVAVLMATALFLTACARKEPEPAAKAPTRAEAEAAVNAIRDGYVTGTNAGDAASVANLFTNDGVRMPPNKPAEAGKDAIQSGLQAELGEYNEVLTAPIDEVEVAGGWAFARGSYTLALTPKAGGKAVEDSGKWLNVMQLQPDGSWKIARHIWNSNNPPPAGAT